jgi:hypothetical protein
MSAIGMITSRNPVHAAMYLVFAFFNSAIIWMLMEASSGHCAGARLRRCGNGVVHVRRHDARHQSCAVT